MKRIKEELKLREWMKINRRGGNIFRRKEEKKGAGYEEGKGGAKQAKKRKDPREHTYTYTPLILHTHNLYHYEHKKRRRRKRNTITVISDAGYVRMYVCIYLSMYARVEYFSFFLSCSLVPI